MRRNIVGKKGRHTPAKRKTTHRRKHRVSGIGKIDFGKIATKLALLTAGSVLARELSTILLKQFPTFSQLEIGIGQIALGVLLPMFVKQGYAQDIGNGMIAFGGQVVLVNAGVISGVQGKPVMSYRINGAAGNYLNAVSGVGRIAGVNNMSVVHGINNHNRIQSPIVRKRGGYNTY